MHSKILFLDAYDSFSNNIVDQLERQTGADVTSVKIDDKRFWNRTDHYFLDYLSGFDAVVAGPGPGSPDIKNDIGLIGRLWSLSEQHLLPVLGICLGFQSLAIAHGASIQRLKAPRHGLVANIHHSGSSLFAQSSGAVRATQYNSLHVILPLSEEGADRSDSRFLWEPSELLQPLAWIVDDPENGPICMALKHRGKPFWGVQYHPESVCTNSEGSAVFSTWWREALTWRKSHQCPMTPPRTPSEITCNDVDAIGLDNEDFAEVIPSQVSWLAIPLAHALTSEILAAAQTSASNQCLLLESGTRVDGTPVNRETGRYSIITCATSEQFEYYAEQKLLRTTSGLYETVITPTETMWEPLKRFMAAYRAVDGPPESPFWGGLVGFASYEACLQSIGVAPDANGSDIPDAIFVFASRSIVIDHIKKRVYVQSVQVNDDGWVKSTTDMLDAVCCQCRPMEASSIGNIGSVIPKTNSKICQQPSCLEYSNKILCCKDEIMAGNSYELCLTDRTIIREADSNNTDARTDSKLYQKLQLANPAPFSAFLKFNAQQHTVSILSSSPERFMSWTRQGRVQFRPIKGTVRKGPGVDRAKAEAILSSPKEQAENLMIADLIRHDLHGVVGSGNVEVTKLMSIEEYETVYQLVSVIEGQLPDNGSKTGVDALAASLPPGSMTGAPKKRSCELLQEIEGHKPRGVYSGVLGYLDVGGGGDFSVVIRTAVKWTPSDSAGQDRAGPGHWSIGAGGAITAQSTTDGEWEEMEGKRAALLKVFVDA